MIDLPDKKYRVIYADPPWYTPHGMGAGEGISSTKYFPVMKNEDICNLPIPEICEKNAVLFLWYIHSLLPDALEVMKFWGFKFVNTAFVWIKLSSKNNPISVLGGWTMTGSECCLLGRKGRIHPVKYGIQQVAMEQRQRHARKPDEIRQRIDKMMGDCSKIELFARERFEGWDAWGNEM